MKLAFHHNVIDTKPGTVVISARQNSCDLNSLDLSMFSKISP